MRCPICRYLCTFLPRLIWLTFFLYVCFMVYCYIYLTRVWSNVHKPSLLSPCTILFTVLTCEVVNNTYFAMTWKWKFVFIFYGLCMVYELEVIKHFTMALCCTVTVYRILKFMTNSMCHLPWVSQFKVVSFAAVYSFHYLCPVLTCQLG